MGLGLEVGMLADLRVNDEEGYEHFLSEFRKINQYLQRAGLPQHHEPEDCEIWSCDMYGYSGLHYLRRLAAHLDLTGEIPAPGDREVLEDPILKRYYRSATRARGNNLMRFWGFSRVHQRGFDHLILHSDAEGYYLPIDFADVLFPNKARGTMEGMVGSSVRLLRECERIATVLGIPPDVDEESEVLWEAADSQGEGDSLWERYGIESFTCVCLIRGCQKSVETGAALVFV